MYLPAHRFELALESRLARKSAQTYQKGIFSRFGTFPEVFEQVKELLMLKLHKIIRVSHAVACPIVFILFLKQSWQREVFKTVKINHFLVFLAVWVLFIKIFDRLRGGLC